MAGFLFGRLERPAQLVSAIQEMFEVDLRDGVGVDASVDEAASIEAISESRVVMQAPRVRRASSP
ncbi:hypothetical protein A6U98_15085 [Rhizobium sp. WYCCWR10014]|nr:hypothetical protein A6U98_15085 [Rhizobium sp. WYCCWR10014]